MSWLKEVKTEAERLRQIAQQEAVRVQKREEARQKAIQNFIDDHLEPSVSLILDQWYAAGMDLVLEQVRDEIFPESEFTRLRLNIFKNHALEADRSVGILGNLFKMTTNGFRGEQTVTPVPSIASWYKQEFNYPRDPHDLEAMTVSSSIGHPIAVTDQRNVGIVVATKTDLKILLNRKKRQVILESGTVEGYDSGWVSEVPYTTNNILFQRSVAEHLKTYFGKVASGREGLV